MVTNESFFVRGSSRPTGCETYLNLLFMQRIGPKWINQSPGVRGGGGGYSMCSPNVKKVHLLLLLPFSFAAC